MMRHHHFPVGKLDKSCSNNWVLEREAAPITAVVMSPRQAGEAPAAPAEGEEAVPKGVPQFWLNVLRNCEELAEHVRAVCVTVCYLTATLTEPTLFAAGPKNVSIMDAALTRKSSCCGVS